MIFDRFLHKSCLWRKITYDERQNSEIVPKFFSQLLILGLALSIAKVSTRSGCYTWDTSRVSFLVICLYVA